MTTRVLEDSEIKAIFSAGVAVSNFPENVNGVRAKRNEVLRRQ